MATLKEAIEKVGVGGKVMHADDSKPSTVIAIGTVLALLREEGIECSRILSGQDWFPVLPKKRVVLQAWEYKPTGGIFWYEHAPKNALIEDCAHRTDIPNMVFEDGKWVFE